MFAFTQDNFGIFPSESVMVSLVGLKLMRGKVAITDHSFPFAHHKLMMALIGCVIMLPILAHLLLRAPTPSIRLILSLIQPLPTHSLIMKSASVS